jgi:hypothetical protein
MRLLLGDLRLSIQRTRICENTSSVCRERFPHLPQAGVSVGDDRWLVEERQRGLRKPNEDAVFRAFGAERQAEGNNR